MWLTCLPVELQLSRDSALSCLHPCNPSPAHAFPSSAWWICLALSITSARCPGHTSQSVWVILLRRNCYPPWIPSTGTLPQAHSAQLVHTSVSGTRPQTQWTFAIEAKTISAQTGEWPARQWMELHSFAWSVPWTLTPNACLPSPFLPYCSWVLLIYTAQYQ